MKRFTETDKWRDVWFRRLTPISKLAFIFVIENCDAAGVWDPDFDLADFTIGEKVPWPTVLAELGDRVTLLSNGKWHLTRFVEFQYGELVEECRPHAKVLQLLKAHGIPYRKGIRRVSIPTGLDRKNTGQDKDQDQGAVTAEVIYEVYPRKEARQDALRAIRNAMEKCEPAKLLASTKAYAAAVEKWAKDDRQYVPHPATWFNRGSYDDDPANWERRAGQKPDIGRKAGFA